MKSLRQKRHLKIRQHLAGSKERPRLSVFRSNQHIIGQLINDLEGRTLVFEADFKIDKGISKSQRASLVGEKLAEKALKLGIKKVVFDRGGFLYHGRIKKLAEGAREKGLEF